MMEKKIGTLKGCKRLAASQAYFTLYLILSLASTACNSFRSGHPSRVLIFSRNDRVVYASLRPPATICEPSRLNAFAD
jgi:hypothetical protein